MKKTVTLLSLYSGVKLKLKLVKENTPFGVCFSLSFITLLTSTLFSKVTSKVSKVAFKWTTLLPLKFLAKSSTFSKNEKKTPVPLLQENNRNSPMSYMTLLQEEVVFE